MTAIGGPSSARAPDPPRRFRGAFHSDAVRRQAMAGASGPIRILPAAVAVPVDAEDVATLVVWARAEGVALVPRGAGTGMPGGNVGPGVALDLSGWARLGDPADGGNAIEAQPGVLATTLEEAAGPIGRFFPALPSSADRCTLGGMVANNAAGVRSFRYGAVRSWVEELDVVLADGSMVHLVRGSSSPRFASLRHTLLQRPGLAPLPWPEVRKNASGYALDHFLPEGDAVDLLVGSEGTLGIVTRVGVRLAPRPQARALVLLPVRELEALDVLSREARAMEASAFEFFGARFLDVAGLREAPATTDLVGDAPALALLEVDGAEDVVDERLRALRSLAADLGVTLTVGRTTSEMERLWRIRHAASPVVASRAEQGLVSMQFIEDSVVPDGALSGYLRGLDRILEDEGTDAVVFGHAGDGNVHVNPLVDVGKPDWRERVRRILDRTVDLVASLGGTLSGEHGDGRIRAPFHDRIFGREVALAFRTVKESLDPHGILNPGVLVPLEGQDPLYGLTPSRRTG